MAGSRQKQLGRSLDPFGIWDALHAVQRAWLTHPAFTLTQAARLTAGMTAVGTFWLRRLRGPEAVEPEPPVVFDERFDDPAWTENPFLETLKESYLASSRWLMDAVHATPGLDDKEKQRAAFWLRQFVDAAAPSNFFWSNPKALRRFIETGGESLREGMRRLARDTLAQDIPMTDRTPFKLGENLAATPGKVVFRNYLFELIQYTPTTDTVYSTPVLFVPPWINKYYVVDLNPRQSMVRWLVERGYTVFMISWKNPGADMKDVRFDDYLTDGVDTAQRVAREITGAPQLHAMGYCIGGTLLSVYLAWLNKGAKSKKSLPVAHWSAFTTLVDFVDPGEIGVFIDEDTLALIDKMMEGGFLDGQKMAYSFRLLRPNNLIWQYYVTNYLLGETPPAFDILYWNTDNTRMPRAMHRFYLREFYLNNKVREPDALTIAGRPIDLRRITQPLYNVAAEQDHIAPWQQVFKLPGLVKGPVRGVLATSGHILGIINPPVNPPKRKYWVGDATGVTDPEQWRAGCPKEPGSWWEDWDRWLAERCGKRVAPPPMGSAEHPVLGDAPGTYVLEP